MELRPGQVLRSLPVAVIVILCIGCSSVRLSESVRPPSTSYPFEPGTIARDDVAPCFRKVLDLSWYGMLGFERAAFLRLDADAHFHCDVWPATFSPLGAKWNAPIPDGTVAILHSHPRFYSDPSRLDRSEAKRVGMPVFIVTGWGIAMVDTNGEIQRFPRLDDLPVR